MTITLTTTDFLLESIRNLFFEINCLIVNSNNDILESTSTITMSNFEINEEQCKIKNTVDESSAVITNNLFKRSFIYHLQAVHFSLPCYTIFCNRFFKSKNNINSILLYSHTPTLWHKLVHVCHLYCITIKIDIDNVTLQLSSANAENFEMKIGKVELSLAEKKWKIKLTHEQELYFLLLPKVIARFGTWKQEITHLMRIILRKWQ